MGGIVCLSLFEAGGQHHTWANNACMLLVLPLLWEAFIWLFALPRYQDCEISKY